MFPTQLFTPVILVFFKSSSAVYLNSFREDDIIDMHKLNNSYAKNKLMNKMVADSYSDIYGISIIGMRFFNVYSEGDNSKGYYASIISQFLKAHKEGKPLIIYGDGKQAGALYTPRMLSI